MNEFFHNCLVDVNQIGIGGVGYVKSGFYPNHGTIAFKIQFDGYTENEIDILKSIRHQNIVQILGPLYESENDRTLVGYAMEKMETSLQHVINNREIIYNDGKIFNWMEQVCSGLMFLHNVKNLIHRDVKPLNMLFAPGLINLKLCDFGITKSANISTQSFTGSYFYMSPEVMESKKYTRSTDIYSLGITLWVVKTRRAPYDSVTEFLKSVNGYRPSIEEIDDQRTREIIEQCWAQEPTDRPIAGELQQRFSQLLREDPTPPSLYLPGYNTSIVSASLHPGELIDIIPGENQETNFMEPQPLEEIIVEEQMEEQKPFTTSRLFGAVTDSFRNVGRKVVLEVERFRDRHNIPGAPND